MTKSLQIESSFPEPVQSADSQVDTYKVFSSLMLFQTGPFAHQKTSADDSCYGAKFKLNRTIGGLFPYINAVINGAKYYSKPEYIRFRLADRLCVLYPTEGAFTPVANHAEAVDFLKILLNSIADIDSKREEIVPNHRKYSPASPLDIYKLLPGSNCQDCGYKTCMAFAAAVSRQYTNLGKCPHCATPVEEKSTFRITDKQGKTVETISLAIDTSCLHKTVSRKDEHIQTLQNRLAEFEQSRDATIADINAKLLSPLTRREIEVLKMVALGETNKEISVALYISEHTVKTHVGHIFNKLGVNDRTQASVWAAKNGFL